VLELQRNDRKEPHDDDIVDGIPVVAGDAVELTVRHRLQQDGRPGPVADQVHGQQAGADAAPSSVELLRVVDDAAEGDVIHTSATARNAKTTPKPSTAAQPTHCGAHTGRKWGWPSMLKGMLE